MELYYVYFLVTTGDGVTKRIEHKYNPLLKLDLLELTQYHQDPIFFEVIHQEVDVDKDTIQVPMSRQRLNIAVEGVWWEKFYKEINNGPAYSVSTQPV